VKYGIEILKPSDLIMAHGSLEEEQFTEASQARRTVFRRLQWGEQKHAKGMSVPVPTWSRQFPMFLKKFSSSLGNQYTIRGEVHSVDDDR
jgi:hypothetical protein